MTQPQQQQQPAFFTSPAEMKQIAQQQQQPVQQQQLPACLMTSPQMKQIAQTRPAELIEDFVPSGGAMLLAGAPGTGKSFTALSWAAAIAGGSEWFGHATRQAPVVYVLGEDFSRFGDRIVGWEKAYKRPMPENLYYIDGQDFGLDLKDQSSVHQLLDVLAYVQPGLIIFDTFSVLAQVSNENDNAEIAQVMGTVNRIVKATGATALLIHHLTKSTGSVRGAGAFVGNVDTAVIASVEVHNGAASDRFMLSTETSKGGKRRHGEAKTLRGFKITWPGVLDRDDAVGTVYPDPNDPDTQDKSLAAATEALARYKDEHNPQN